MVLILGSQNLVIIILFKYVLLFKLDNLFIKEWQKYEGILDFFHIKYSKNTKEKIMLSLR